MYCRNCGSKMPNEAAFCRNCGSSMKQEQIITPGQQQSPPAVNAAPQHDKPPQQVSSAYSQNTYQTFGQSSAQHSPQGHETRPASAYTPYQQPPQPAKRKKKSGSKARIKTAVIIAMSVVTAALIALVLLFVFGVLPPEPNSDDIVFCDIQKSDEGLVFTIITGGETYSDLLFEYNGDEYDEVDAEDFMDEPVDLTLYIKGDSDDLESVTLKKFMVIDTDLDDSVHWVDYEKAMTLFVHDPHGNVESVDIAELDKLEALYLCDFADASGLKALKNLDKLSSLSLSGGPLEDLSKIESLSTLEMLSLSGLSITSMDGIDNIEGLIFLQLQSLNKLKSFDEIKRLSNLKLFAMNSLTKISAEDADDVTGYLEENGVVVAGLLIPDRVILDPSSLTIGFITAGPDEYYKIYEDTFVLLAERQGITVVSKQSDYSGELELRHAQDLIEDGVDALVVISAQSDLSYKTIELANQNNVPIFFMFNLPEFDPEVLTVAGQIDFSFSVNSYRLAQWVADNYDDPDCAIIPGLIGDGRAEAQIVGFDKGLKDAGLQPVQLLESSEWQYTNAYSIANYWFFHDREADIIFCCNDSTYDGARDALKVYKQVKLVSSDGKDEYWEDLESDNGYLRATIPLPPTLLTDLCLQQVIAYFSGEDYCVKLDVITEVMAILVDDTAISWIPDTYLEARDGDRFEYSLDYYTQVYNDNKELIDELDLLTQKFMDDYN